MKTLRRTARFVLASLVWLHAVLIFDIARPNLAPLAAGLGLNIAETTVLCAIAALSVLSTYGVGNILIDIAYIYFFPFVLLYHFARIAYKVIRRLDRIFANVGTNKDERIELSTIPGWPTIKTVAVPSTSSPTSTSTVQSTAKSVAEAIPIWRRLWSTVTTPFTRFSLLWCLLLLLTSKTLLVWIALAVVLYRILRLLITVAAVTFVSTSWLTQLEERIKSYAETWIEKILAANEAAPPNDLTQTLASLTSLQVVLVLLHNRQRVAQWAIFLGSLVFSSIYLYLALLFSFVYCGIARLSHAHLSWTNSLADSVFIPFAYSDLAINVPLKWAAGIHAFFVVAVGVTTFFSYLRRRLDSFYDLADALHSRIQQPEVQTKIVTVAEKLKNNTGAPASQTSASASGS